MGFWRGDRRTCAQGAPGALFARGARKITQDEVAIFSCSWRLGVDMVGTLKGGGGGPSSEVLNKLESIHDPLLVFTAHFGGPLHAY